MTVEPGGGAILRLVKKQMAACTYVKDFQGNFGKFR